jgi:hypothetical protein
VLVGIGVPEELRDPDALVWHNQARYRAWMSVRRWPMPPSERMGVAAHPANRRSYAAAAWARGNGIGRDWHRLRARGLCEHQPAAGN